MRYTADDKGILNNFAVEPTVYVAEYPMALPRHAALSAEEQRRYFFQGAAALLLVSVLVLTALAVS
jgi:hypothetical protein